VQPDSVLVIAHAKWHAVPAGHWQGGGGGGEGGSSEATSVLGSAASAASLSVFGVRQSSFKSPPLFQVGLSAT